MKVIILNAGVGKRLQPLTDNIPKCLIKILNNKTILDHQLNNLIKCKLNDLIILTGPFEEKIKKHVENNYPSLNVQYIHNPKFDKTDYIYSLYLVKDFLDGDIILFHGDLIFSELLLKNIVKSSIPNCVLVNKEILPPKKDFKALITNNKIQKIGVNVFGLNTAFLAPFYKLTKSFFNKWLNQIEKFIASEKTNCYAEEALNEILDHVNLKPFFYDGLICMEIDDFEDLDIAKKLFKKFNLKLLNF